MTENDRYIPGVPCWVDATFPDPVAAVDFYSGLFGWECEDSMPAEAPGHYFTARIGGQEAAAISSLGDDGSTPGSWSTYVWVDNADATTKTARNAGATVVAEPVDVFDAGRAAWLRDPEGAAIALWEPARHRGAQAVNTHGGVNFNDLYTRDLDSAAAFYGAVFGWELIPVEDGFAWGIPAYGDFLEARMPGMRAGMEAMGAPDRFETVVATAVVLDDDTEAHWGVTFAVDDADEAARRARELGGTVVSEPTDDTWTRTTTIRDPQGATFVASQFVPPEPNSA